MPYAITGNSASPEIKGGEMPYPEERSDRKGKCGIVEVLGLIIIILLAIWIGWR
jgi:hypothetical protein